MHEDVSVGIIVRAKNEAEAVLKGVADHLGAIGKAAALVGVVAVALGVGIAATSLKMAGDFQEATTAIVTGAGESAKNLNLIREGLLRLAPEVGKTPKELADGLYFIESAGYHGAAGLKVLEAAAIAAKVGEADMAVVSDALTSAMNAYHLPAEQATRVTDQLLATVAAGKMHMSDLAANIGKVLPVASIAHVSLTEVGAAMATMTAQGTDASMATTSLRFLLMAMINPTSQAATALKEVGLSAKDLFTALTNPSVGLHGALDMITTHINTKFKPGSQEAAAALAQIVGGTRGMTAALELSGQNMATFRANLTSIAAASTGTGKTMEGWTRVQHDLNTQIDRLKAAVIVVAIELGQRLLPIATQFIHWAADAVPRLLPVAITIGIVMVNAIRTLATAVGIGITVITAIVGAIVNVLGFVERWRIAFIALAAVITTLMLPSIIRFAVVTGVDALLAAAAFGEQIVLNSRRLIEQGAAMVAANARTIALTVSTVATAVATGAWTAAQWLLNVALSANPIALVVIAIALLIGGLILAYQHSSAFRAIVQAVWGQIESFGRSLVVAFQAVTGFIGGIVRAIQAMGGLGGMAQTAWRAIVNAITGAVTGLLTWLGRELPQIPYQLGYALGLAIGTVIRFGLNLIQWASTAIPAFLTAIVSFLSALPGQFWALLVQTFQQLVTWDRQIVAWAATAITSFVSLIITYFSQLPGRMWALLQQVVADDIAFGRQIVSWASTAIPVFVNAVVSFIATLPGRVWTWLVNTIANIANFGRQMATNGTNAGQSFVTTLTSALSKLPGQMLAIGQAIVHGIWDGIQSLAGWLGSQATNFAGGILNGIKKGLGISSPSLVAFKEVGLPTGMGVVQGIVASIQGQAGVVTSAIRSVSAAGAGSGALPASSPAFAPALGASFISQGGPAAASAPVGGGRDVIIPVMLDGREIGRAVIKELELIRKLRGGGNQMAGAAG